jgi:hypothetical protein
MGSSDKAGVAETLRLEHEQIRARLQQAMNASPPVSAAAERLALLCFPHFESEERIVFPVLERIRRLPGSSVDLANTIARHERAEDDLGMAVYDLGIARKSRP